MPPATAAEPAQSCKTMASADGLDGLVTRPTQNLSHDTSLIPQSGAHQPVRWSQPAAAVLVAIVALALYAGTVDAEFLLHWDDGRYIPYNPFVRNGLTVDGLIAAVSTFAVGNWHPVTWWSHMLDVELFGLDPAGHHAMNAAWHALNSMLVLVLLSRLGFGLASALTGALLFAVHPLHVESVAWVAERKDLVTTCFGLGTLIVWIDHTRRPGRRGYALALVLYLLALGAKQMLVTLPFLLLMLDLWPLKRYPSLSAGRLLREKLPFFLLALAAAVVILAAQRSGQAMQALETFPFDLRVANAIVAYQTYLAKTLWPTDLVFIYPYQAPTGVEVVLAAAVLLAVSAAALGLRRRAPWLLFGWCWFLGTLVPVIGLVQVGVQPFADRYMYFPLLGLIIAVCGMLDILAKPRLAALAVLPALAALAWVSHAQVGVWRNELTLTRHAVRHSTGNDRAGAMLATQLYERGHYEEAIDAGKQAIALNPRRRTAYLAVANSLRRLDQQDAAEAWLRRVLEIHPRYNDARFSLGALLMDRHQLDEAEQLFLSLTDAPDSTLRYNAAINLGVIAQQTGRLDAAMAQYRAAAAEKPTEGDPLYNLALAQLRMGHVDAARKSLIEALRRDPDHAAAQRRLARIEGGSR